MGLSARTVRYLRENCPGGLKGKTALITGANSGIGFCTAETLLALGASVILACRNTRKAAEARDRLAEEFPGADIRTVWLDMADFRSIDAFARELPEVDVFIHNAGVWHRPGERTRDGFELVMGTNYLGVYYLGEKVLPLLLARGREVLYIHTVSIVYRTARVDYRHFYRERGAYSRSKLCLARYTVALAEQYKGSCVHVMMVHPGIAVTRIADHLLGGLCRLKWLSPFNSVEKSSLAAAWLLSHPVPDGSLAGPRGFLGIWGYPGPVRIHRKARTGTEELLAFTAREIARKNAERNEPEE